MGRRKIAIKTIKDPKLRHSTFNKRKNGLIKKAAEISMLCDIRLLLIFEDVSGKLIQYSTHGVYKPEEYFSQMTQLTPENNEEFTCKDYPNFFKVNHYKKTRDRMKIEEGDTGDKMELPSDYDDDEDEDDDDQEEEDDDEEKIEVVRTFTTRRQLEKKQKEQVRPTHPVSQSIKEKVSKMAAAKLEHQQQLKEEPIKGAALKKKNLKLDISNNSQQQTQTTRGQTTSTHLIINANESAPEKKSEPKLEMPIDRNNNAAKFLPMMYPMPSPGSKPNFVIPHGFPTGGLDSAGNGFLHGKTPLAMTPGAFQFGFDPNLMNLIQNFSPTEPRRESHDPNNIRQEQPPQSPSGMPWNSHPKLEDISPMFRPPALKDKMPGTNLNLPQRDDLQSPFKLLNPLTPNQHAFEFILSAMKKNMQTPRDPSQKDLDDPNKGSGIAGGAFDFNLANLGLPMASPGLLFSANRGFIPGPLDSNMGPPRYQAFTFDDFDESSRNQALGDTIEKKVKK